MPAFRTLSLILMLFGSSMSLLAQGKLIEVHPQSPSSSAVSRGINHIFFGNNINVLTSENFKNFGNPSYSVFYLQQYDYNLNLVKEEPVKYLNYTDTIYTQESITGGYLTNNSGYYIYVKGINNVANKSLLEVRDSSGNVVFSKNDYVLLDVPILFNSINYAGDFALRKNNRLYQVSATGTEIASFDLDSLQSIILNNHFPQGDSLCLTKRFASKPSSNNNYYLAEVFRNGIQTFHYCKFNYSFQLLDTLAVSLLNDYRIVNHEDELLLWSDSVVIDTSANTFQAFHFYRDFDLNLKLSFQTDGRIVYSSSGPRETDQPIFLFDGSLNVANSESHIKPLDTLVISRLRHYSKDGVQQLDHLLHQEGMPENPSSISVNGLFGRTNNNEFIVDIRSYFGNFGSYKSYLLKIDSQGNSPLSVKAIAENKVVDLYPNPSKNWIKINTKEPFEKFGIKIFDLQGQIVFNQGAISGQQINISELPPGTYFMHLEGKKGAWLNTYQFIKL